MLSGQILLLFIAPNEWVDYTDFARIIFAQANLQGGYETNSGLQANWFRKQEDKIKDQTKDFGYLR